MMMQPKGEERDSATDRPIGVIGGLGPYAGLDLVRKIFDDTIASGDDEHLPVVLVSFPGRIPDRSAFIADPNSPSPVEPLARILGLLDDAGCHVAGVPCNTAHAPVIFEPLLAFLKRENRRIRLLDMVAVCAESVHEVAPGAQKVGIIATSATIDTNLYSLALAAVGLEAVAPDSEFQERVVQPAIFNREWGLKAASNPPPPRAREHLLDAVEHLRQRGADTVILGCTELPLAIPESAIGDVRIIDSTRSLARALIRESHPERLRPT